MQRKQLDVFQGRSLTGSSVQVVKTTTILSATSRKSSQLNNNTTHNLNHRHRHYNDGNIIDTDTVVLQPQLMITDNIVIHLNKQ